MKKLKKKIDTIISWGTKLNFTLRIKQFFVRYLLKKIIIVVESGALSFFLAKKYCFRT